MRLAPRRHTGHFEPMLDDPERRARRNPVLREVGWLGIKSGSRGTLFHTGVQGDNPYTSPRIAEHLS